MEAVHEVRDVLPGIHVAAGERILMEVSRKWTAQDLRMLAYRSNYSIQVRVYGSNVFSRGEGLYCDELPAFQGMYLTTVLFFPTSQVRVPRNCLCLTTACTSKQVFTHFEKCFPYASSFTFASDVFTTPHNAKPSHSHLKQN